MTAPNPPNFRTASDDDAWWLVGYPGPDGQPQVSQCSSGGRAFVDNLQMILGVTVDGRWGPGTSTALANALRNAGASSGLVSGAQNEAAVRTVGIGQLRGAVFLMHQGQAFGGNTPIGIAEGSVAIPPNTIGPAWDVAAPPGPSGDVPPTCVSRSAPGPTQQPIQEVPFQVPPPPQLNPVQPRPTVTPAQPSTGMSGGTITLIVVGAAAVIGAVVYARQGNRPRPSRQNPGATNSEIQRRRDQNAWKRLGLYLSRELDGAIDSGDLARLNAVHEIATYEGTTAGRLIEMIRRGTGQQDIPYVFWFVTEACGSRRCQKALLSAIGKDREDLLVMQERLRAR